MLVPPDNFGLVETGVYRCSKLEAGHLPFLETLQLTSLVILDAVKPPRTLKSFLDTHNVTMYNLGSMKISNHQNTESNSDQSDGLASSVQKSSKYELEMILLERTKSKNDLWMILERNLIVAAFEILFDRSKHNVLFVDLLLALVGILRKIQKWNFNSIVNEYRIYTGNASKNNYNVEVFLELVQTELLPYEVEVALKKRDESTDSAAPKNRHHHKVSVDDFTGDEEDTVSLEDYDDDMDDDMLSASPQIPANLLKLVEQRKNDDKPSPGTSPDYRKGSSGISRNGSVDTISTMQQRRKSSVDSRYIQKNNTRFRNPSFSLPISPCHRGLFDSGLRQFRLEKDKMVLDEILRLKEKYNYKYYRSATVFHMPGLDVIRLRLPPEANLPEWFVNGRNYWESTRG